MTTVWVDNGSERGNHGHDPAFVDHRITDVADWLDDILKGPRMTDQLAATIDAAWDARDTISTATTGEVRDAVEAALGLLDSGRGARRREGRRRLAGQPVAQESGAAVVPPQRRWPRSPAARAARRGGTRSIRNSSAGTRRGSARRASARCPGAIVRRGAYIAPGAVLMPSFVNLGAYVGEGTMIDTWATVGSCAQIGRNVHISGGAGIGGVLEPLQAGPVIIEDDCFIGARSEVAEGVIVEQGAVLSMGVFLGASTKIVDRATGEVMYGRVPAYSVVVPGALPGEKGGPSLACAVIVKRVDERTRSQDQHQRAAARLGHKLQLIDRPAPFDWASAAGRP